MTVADDLAYIRPWLGSDDAKAALKRVEAEIARLQRHPDAWSQQAFDQQKARADAAETEAARLRDGLRSSRGKAAARMDGNGWRDLAQGRCE